MHGRAGGQNAAQYGVDPVETRIETPEQTVYNPKRTTQSAGDQVPPREDGAVLGDLGEPPPAPP